MLFFGHVGLTLGAALVVNKLYGINRERARPEIGAVTAEDPPVPLSGARPSDPARGFLDLRWWILGSMLPDIIDKPLGLFLFHNGRIFAHSLVFAMVLLAAGLYLGIFIKRPWLLALSFGVLAHLLLDAMWQTPETFLWPFRGIEFASYDNSGWLEGLFRGLLNEYSVYVPEFIGFIITAGFALAMALRKRVTGFINHGVY